MSSLYQTLFITLAVIFAYIWFNIPILADYSLQAFAFSILLYIILKRLNQTNVWNILPNTAVDEMSLITFSFLILVASTGAVTSIFFPLNYVLIFFLAMTCTAPTAIITTLELSIFYYALSPNLLPYNISMIVSLPVILIFFLFAKRQYEDLQKSKQVIAMENEQIINYQQFVEEQNKRIFGLENQNQQLTKTVKLPQIEQLVIFLEQDLRPKITQLQKLSKFRQNKMIIQSQLTLMGLEIEKLLKKFKKEDI